MAKILKIVIPILIIVLLVVGFFVSSNVMVKKVIEIDANAQVLIKLNNKDEIVKIVPYDSKAQKIIEQTGMDFDTPLDFIETYVEKSYENGNLDNDEIVNYLFATNDFEKDITLLKDISTQLALITDNTVNQYKVTKKDYDVINNVKGKVDYTTFEIIEQGFVSKEKSPYITYIQYKNDSYYINFSKEVLFNGNEEVICTYGNLRFEVTPAGYNNNSLAVFVENATSDVTLNFDVTLKDYANMTGFCISPTIAEEEEELEYDVDFSVDSELNQEKLDLLYDEIIDADISDRDRDELLRQYEILENSIYSITSDEETNDFNIMYQNLIDSLMAFSDEYNVDEPASSEVASTKPTTTAKPTTKPTTTETAEPSPSATPTPSPTQEVVDYAKLNSDYYNQLNLYKAMVLNISDETTRNTLNAEINQCYYKLSIATTKEDYDNYANQLATFEANLTPYMY